MASLILMIQFMTRYPLPGTIPFTVEHFVQGMKWMPLVGLFIGMPAALAMLLLSSLLGPEVSAFLAVAILIIVTGGLHLDGIGDTADGLFSCQSKDKVLAIMRDSTLGANGVIAIVLTILIKYLLLASLPVTVAVTALLAAPLCARMALTWHAATAKYARAEAGLGEFVNQVGTAQAMAATLFALGLLIPVLLLLHLSLHLHLLILTTIVAFTILVAVLFARSLTKKVGGITGDTIGATIELCEISTLLILYLFWKHLL
ncbi:MAG: adenosylcobinamide-GDP ribazoletransferase [Desulfobulbaceae bacterium]|nr:adenosylcobinamide-GDP ribazoletransferase [Desulfobulbaceae bacterium]